MKRRLFWMGVAISGPRVRPHLRQRLIVYRPGVGQGIQGVKLPAMDDKTQLLCRHRRLSPRPSGQSSISDHVEAHSLACYQLVYGPARSERGGDERQVEAGHYCQDCHLLSDQLPGAPVPGAGPPALNGQDHRALGTSHCHLFHHDKRVLVAQTGRYTDTDQGLSKGRSDAGQDPTGRRRNRLPRLGADPPRLHR